MKPGAFIIVDTVIATTIWPELTTVRQPITAMAEAAISLLVNQISAPRLRPPIRIVNQQ